MYNGREWVKAENKGIRCSCDCPKVIMENFSSRNLNGEYISINDTANGRKIYKHTKEKLYMYSEGKQWLISEDYKLGNSRSSIIDVGLLFY